METTHLHSKKYLYAQIAVGVLSSWLFGLGIFIILYALLQYKNESLTLSQHSIVLKKGIVSRSNIEIPYSKVNTVNTYKDLIGLILGIGDIGIFSANSTTAEIFKNIDNPEKLKQEVMARVHNTP